MWIEAAADINVQVIVPNENQSAPPLVATERRITPSWTVSQLKAKLEPITGIPASSQILRARTLDGNTVSLADDSSLLSNAAYGLRKGSEIEVIDSRPPGARPNFNDVSSVEKYEMPAEQYEQLDDSVLAWKKRNQLGRFDPNAKPASAQAVERRQMDERDIKLKGIAVGKRCRVGNDDWKRGEVKFVGEIPGLGGERELGCIWVGVEYDEPIGLNDGSVEVVINGKKERRQVFKAHSKSGVFTRPERVEVGHFLPQDDDVFDDGTYGDDDDDDEL